MWPLMPYDKIEVAPSKKKGWEPLLYQFHTKLRCIVHHLQPSQDLLKFNVGLIIFMWDVKSSEQSSGGLSHEITQLWLSWGDCSGGDCPGIDCPVTYCRKPAGIKLTQINVQVGLFRARAS